jgi:hypothetical protein
VQITIRVPKTKTDRWVVSNHYRRRSAGTLLKLIERQVVKAVAKEKTCVVVNYGKDTNETLESKDSNYLIYTTVCFLEDYLSYEIIKRYENLYSLNFK